MLTCNQHSNQMYKIIKTLKNKMNEIPPLHGRQEIAYSDLETSETTHKKTAVRKKQKMMQ